ncbi:hypothetical protein [Natrinema sp. 1APR25-10V2]|uniref:DUF7096 domain-containing protein n=1 Tax=Natrinema sp. 1APR25-10V2 TaxID=2951081 RepID=UPI0028754CA0|nr:hypothetical protein [Natrinema sp. 1APR25-10V2]MDS0474216.1 DUF4198 domain-containing protein [Natrinema sp. 1APR25-10V2]
MRRTAIGAVLIAVLVAGMAVPATAASVGQSHSRANSGAAAAMVVQENATNDSDSSVDVTVGQQLSTVIDVSSDEVRTDFENTAFEMSVESADDEERAEAVAERAEELRDRAEDVREEYEEATEEYEAGEMSKSEYAQRIATLNARAANLADSYAQLQQRASNVSASELRTLDDSMDNLSSVSGSGAKALLERFTGESQGEVELETAGGLSIEVKGEDGERSRELERERDDDDTISVSQSAALETAQAALSTPERGSWVHVESNVKDDEGAYEFEFALENATAQTGEAEVRVDGSSGDVYKLEEEIEARDEDERDDDDEREDDEREDDETDARALTVDATLDGDTVTVTVTADGSGVANATVDANDRSVGTTDADGTVTFTVDANETEDLELTVREGESEAETEYVIRDGSLVTTEGEEDEPTDDDDRDDEDADDETERTDSDGDDD